MGGHEYAHPDDPARHVANGGYQTQVPPESRRLGVLVHVGVGVGVGGGVVVGGGGG